MSPKSQFSVIYIHVFFGTVKKFYHGGFNNEFNTFTGLIELIFPS